MPSLEAKLEALRIRYETRPVRVMVVKEVGKIVIDGVEIELRKGTEIEVPRWIAKVLEEKGIVEPLESPMSLDDIARVHFIVTEARSLADTPSLPEDFYFRAADYLRRLETELRRRPEPQLLEEKSKAELYFEEIVSRRLWTILQLLRSPGARAEVYEKLSPEEKTLHDDLLARIEEWKRRVAPHPA
ncbi:hypothetical protein Pyrfu_0369 [Pyrolobus fumarii 1A]|uniref:GINS subunit domain-containing protein n=1 Tax=Pyrolobus fumarii (strain DSM 11204 / 1A) TaxID=694429 RepID=G0EFS0_PYRF1|nr:hypothetical protein [Pyrolobus fumarii]AEM38241.1 hypothetical protein Pyrfu_0369 [Pyrolobus fumarii 1A]